MDSQHKGELLAWWAHDASGHQGRDATDKWAHDRGVHLTMDTVPDVCHSLSTPSVQDSPEGEHLLPRLGTGDTQISTSRNLIAA